MPYRRKSYPSRRGKTRRRATPWYNRKYNAMQLAAKAARGVWYLKGLVNSEVMKLDNALTSSVIDATTGTVISCTGVNQGDGVGNRTGISILVRSLLARLRITKASTPLTTYVRMYIVIDSQQVGDTIPAIADLLHTVDVDSPLSNATVGRFKILKSRTIYLTNDSPPYHLDYPLKMRHHVRYNGTSSADIQKGGTYIMLLSGQTTVGNQPSLDGHIRLSYHDN